ncbi:MAG TPA: glycosyltransferase family 4 protein [Nodosilinea sp.]|nr:glycosyltransferase family 4 protein [Nodosilinea sp.]
MQKKIAVIGNNWFPTQPGGLDRYVYELVHGLVSLDYGVDLYGLGLPAQSTVPALNLHNLASHDQGLVQRLSSAYGRSRGLGQGELQAVNLHFALYSFAALPHLPHGVPVTCNFHGPWALESQQEGAGRLSVAFKQWVEQRVYSRCDRFIVLSKAFGTVLHQHYGIPWERIHIIPGGVDTTRFQNNLARDAARTHLGWPSDRFVLFTPRRLVQRMGIGPLLSALVQVRQQVPEVWLAIAGKGPLRAALARQATELGLDDCVRFLGFVPDDDLPVAYQAADLTVIPSQALEGFGLVLLESLACGTPAVCTPVGGMPEVLLPFNPDLVFTSGGEGAIAQRLLDFGQRKMPLPSRDDCRAYAEGFAWGAIASQVSKILLQTAL